MGELFNHPREWTTLITARQIDYRRMHISQMGGITPAKKVAGMGEIYGVRTAWHGSGDVSPIGHASNVHLDLTCLNFGIQEWIGNAETLQKVFPGTPEQRGGTSIQVKSLVWVLKSTKKSLRSIPTLRGYLLGRRRGSRMERFIDRKGGRLVR